MLRRYVVTFKCLRASLRKILQSEASADVHRHMEENSILACEISDVRTPRANNVIVPAIMQSGNPDFTPPNAASIPD